MLHAPRWLLIGVMKVLPDQTRRSDNQRRGERNPWPLCAHVRACRRHHQSGHTNQDAVQRRGKLRQRSDADRNTSENPPSRVASDASQHHTKQRQLGPDEIEDHRLHQDRCAHEYR